VGEASGIPAAPAQVVKTPLVLSRRVAPVLHAPCAKGLLLFALKQVYTVISGPKDLQAPGNFVPPGMVECLELSVMREEERPPAFLSPTHKSSDFEANRGLGS